VLRPSPTPGRLGRLIARFARGRRGAAAVEFALVSIPFFALTFAILDIGMVYFVSIALENATDAAAREIRTGQLQTQGGATAATFKTLICNNMSWIASCTSNLSVNVEEFSTFQSISQPSPVTNGAVNQASLQFQTGGPGDIILVQSFFQWTVLAPSLDNISTPLSGGKTLLSAAVVFQNEPY
jgi:Flp pilus assembly protein TadG